VPAGDVFVMAMNASGPQPRMASSGSHPIMTTPGPQAMMASSGSHPILLASGPQPVMASSGAHPIMTASGASPVVRRASTDAGYVIGDGTGPQPASQAETGPHPVMRMRRRESSRDSMVLWILAGMHVVLAVGVVMVVISWAQ
jgi:hypothetical protein